MPNDCTRNLRAATFMASRAKTRFTRLRSSPRSPPMAATTTRLCCESCSQSPHQNVSLELERMPLVTKRCRIAMTGGPGGGKTTAADLFRRELGEQVVIVPESATILFGGGFPRSTEGAARSSAQAAIFHVQRNLEDVQ